MQQCSDACLPPWDVYSTSFVFRRTFLWQVRASRVPSPDEDREVMHAAFMNAYGQSHHGPRIKGMQEFAGAVSAPHRGTAPVSGVGGALASKLLCCVDPGALPPEA